MSGCNKGRGWGRHLVPAAIPRTSAPRPSARYACSRYKHKSHGLECPSSGVPGKSCGAVRWVHNLGTKKVSRPGAPQASTTHENKPTTKAVCHQSPSKMFSIASNEGGGERTHHRPLQESSKSDT
uniref:Uncharacterized protein n=1 Tax=Mesocestoides corti TaxID=53468 RepID=A0A5K3G1N2_MESCO